MMFKNKTRLGNKFHFKDRISQDLTSSFIYKLRCCIESCARYLNVKIGEHTGISPLTKKQVKLKSNLVADHYYFVTIHHLKMILVF